MKKSKIHNNESIKSQNYKSLLNNKKIGFGNPSSSLSSSNMTNNITATMMKKQDFTNDDNLLKSPNSSSSSSNSSSNTHEFRASSRFFLASLVITFIIPFLVGLGTTRLFHVISPSVPQIVERLHPSAVSLIREQQEKEAVEMTEDEDEKDEDEEDDEDDETIDENADEEDDEDDDDDENELKSREVPPGSGLQLSVDIFSVNPSILSSEDYLLSALSKIISSAQLTLQSLHYNKHLSPDGKLKGWNGVGLLSEGSHVTLNTWIGDDEEEGDGGNVFFSLLSSSNNQLKLQWEVLPIVEKELAIGIESKAEEAKPPVVEWSLVQRQFRIIKGYPRNVYWEDLGGEYTVLSKIKKIEIASAQSPFQRIDVYDIVDPKETSIANYQASLLPASTGTYQSLHPELFLPTRIVFLDGVMQSTSRGNEAYHEALVQPALFAHDAPKRVAIIGGGEGATLREVLKHESLEKCIMIEIDEIMVKESARHLYPRWNGCGDFVGSEDSCFDDKRADIRYEDALAWFINRFYEEPKTIEETEEDEDDSEDDEDEEEEKVTYDETEKFDVIIMDALDPQDTVEFADVLYQNDVFLTSLYNALNDDGILVAQLGESPVLVDAPEEESNDANRLNVIKTMERLGFKSMHIYDEHNCGFEGPWTYLVACKDTKCRKNWYKNPAQIDEAIHRRIKRSHSGKPLLQYFDGTTMASYQIPRRAVETVYCRQSQFPAECQFGSGWNHHHVGVDDAAAGADTTTGSKEPTIVKSRDVFKINVDKKDDGSVITSVTAARDIPSMSYIETEGVLRIPASVVDVMEKARGVDGGEEDDGRLEPLVDFIEQSGIDMDTFKAKGDLYLGVGLPSIIKNADKNQEPNVGHLTSWMKQQSDAAANNNNVVTPEGYEPIIIPPASAVMARHLPHFEGGYLFTLKSIKKGEEILKNPSSLMV